MKPLAPGARAPELTGLPREGARALVFYKVTCPTCQMAAAPMERLATTLGERFHAVVQDPPERAAAFSDQYGTTFQPLSDEPPYEVSNAFGVRVVPTIFVLRDGEVADVVESWDSEGWNRAAESLGAGPVSRESDGLPLFRPG